MSLYRTVSSLQFYQMTGGVCGFMLQFQLATETSKDAGDRRYHVRAYSDGHDNIVAGASSPG